MRTVEQYHMFAPGETVAVGFSGGPDSVCLLSLLLDYKEFYGISIVAAHVNHCLRGEESDADERFVTEFCNSRDIPLKVLRADIRTLAEKKKQSTELCGREFRYRFFESLHTDKIATAHTGSDVIETMFMNICRGASLNGLCSIPPVRGNIVRPLIALSKADTEYYCKTNGIDYVTDSSNNEDFCTRNQFRHTVIPAFKSVAPSFETTALRCVENLRVEEEYMQAQADEAFTRAHLNGSLSVSVLKTLPEAILRRVIARFLIETAHADFETKHLLFLCGRFAEKNAAITLPGGICVRSDGAKLFAAFNNTQTEIELPLILNKNDLSYVYFNGYKINFSYTDYDASSSTDSPAGDRIDIAKLDDMIEIRSIQPGDTIRLLRRNCSKKLKKYYMEEGIDAAQRRQFPVIADRRGVIWAFGAGADASRAVNIDTKKILIIDSESDKNE